MSLQQPKTSTLKKKNVVSKNWIIFDASGKTLGRLASEVAKVLQGKHKPTYTTYIDSGDGVIIINAEKIQVTGAKEAQKVYRHYTGFMSGLRETPYRVMQKRKPTYILEHAIKGMMPKSRLAKAQLKKLRIYAGSEHEQIAQKPIHANI